MVCVATLCMPPGQSDVIARMVVLYFGQGFTMADAQSPQDLVNLYTPDDVSPTEALKHAEEVWEDFRLWRKQWEGLDLDAYMTIGSL